MLRSGEVVSRLQTLTIGQAAKRVGLTPRAIRYYEALGLLRAPARSTQHYRLYDQEALDNLRFIARCRAIGLSAVEMRALRDSSINKTAYTAGVSALREQLKLTEARIRELLSVRRELRRSLTWQNAGSKPVQSTTIVSSIFS